MTCNYHCIGNTNALFIFRFSVPRDDCAKLSALSAMLLRHPAVQVLHLNSNNITDEGCNSLVTALLRNSILKSLNLSENFLTDKSAIVGAKRFTAVIFPRLPSEFFLVSFWVRYFKGSEPCTRADEYKWI